MEPTMDYHFSGENCSEQEREEITQMVQQQIGLSDREQGTFHWDADGDDPIFVVRWMIDREQQRITIHLTDWEDALEQYEEARRRKIAEANEY